MSRLLHPLVFALFTAAPAARAEAPALRIDAPRPETATRLPLIEVAGGAGRSAGLGWDVVIVLDLSESTLHGSGLDLDGDGPGGGSDAALLATLAAPGAALPGLAQRLREIDFDDTILAAELEAASALVARAAGPRIRAGLIGFSNDAQVLAPLGSPPAQLERALDDVRMHLGDHLRGTHYEAALRAAHRMLVPDPAAPLEPRERAIVFLSDGAPSLPVFDGDGGRGAALGAARDAGLDGIRLFAFAFGAEGEAATETLAQMARWTEGRAERVAAPEQLVAALRELDWVDVARVNIQNTSTGSPARAVRLFPDGSFDALVGLAVGANVLRIEAYGGDGSGVYVERRVERLPGAAEADEVSREKALLEALRARTAEMKAWAEVERRREEQRRTLEIAPAPAQP